MLLIAVMRVEVSARPVQLSRVGVKGYRGIVGWVGLGRVPDWKFLQKGAPRCCTVSHYTFNSFELCCALHHTVSHHTSRYKVSQNATRFQLMLHRQFLIAMTTCCVHTCAYMCTTYPVCRLCRSAHFSQFAVRTNCCKSWSSVCHKLEQSRARRPSELL